LYEQLMLLLYVKKTCNVFRGVVVVVLYGWEL